MTAYRPLRAPHAAPAAPPRRSDPIAGAAAQVVLSPVLPPATVKQVPWFAKVADVLGTALLAFVLVVAFAGGGVLVALAFDGPIVVLALLVYAVAFGWVAHRLKL